jgi:hypothetical protein
VVERQQLFAVLDKYPTLFSDKPGSCSILEHEIKVTPNFVSKRLRAYKIPEVLKPEVERQIREMLELGNIKPSKSEMASPVVCVLKGPNGQNGVRLAMDYRYVNKFSAGSAYPITDVNEVIQKVERATFISSVDAKSAFWQIGLKAESQPLSAFVCESGLFEFTRMPFGLKSATNYLCRCRGGFSSPVALGNNTNCRPHDPPQTDAIWRIGGGGGVVMGRSRC